MDMNLHEQLLQAIDDLTVSEQQLKNSRDHYEEQEAIEEVLYYSQLVNRLRSQLNTPQQV